MVGFVPERRCSVGPAPRPKQWTYPCVLTEHVFDKVRSLDMNLAEFEAVLTGTGEVIEESVSLTASRK